MEPCGPRPAFILGGLVLCSLLGASSAEGRELPGCDEQPGTQQEYGQRGLKLYHLAVTTRFTGEQARNRARALRCLEQALARGPLPPAGYPALADLYERVDRNTDALQVHRRFLAEVPEASRPRGSTALALARIDVLRRRLGEVRIQTVPGSEVRVDGNVVGIAPLPAPVALLPGYHVVSSTDPKEPGAALQQSEITIEAGREVVVDLLAVKRAARVDAVPVAGRRKRPVWRLAVGGALLGGGVLMIGFGASALAVDGQCITDGCPIEMVNGVPVRRFFDGKALGGGLVGGGIAIALIGTVFLALPGERTALSLGPISPGAVGGRLAYSF